VDDKTIRIRDLKAEILLTKVFCKVKKSVRLLALDTVDESLFGSKLGKFIWIRAKTLNHNKKLPRKGGWEALLSDPVIHNHKHAYDILKTMDDLEVSATQDYMDDILGKLAFYRNKRKAFNAIHEAYDKLAESDDKEEVYGALTPIASTLNEVKDFSTAECFTRVDKMDVAKRLRQIKQEQKDKSILSTSWWQFDAVNFGLSKGNLLVVAGTTGGGKSAVIALNLLYNFAFQGHRAANSSLEMPEEQNIERIAAFYSDIPLHRIRSYTGLKEDELKKLSDKDKYVEDLIASAGGSYWLFTPDKEYSIDDILELTYAKDPEVILIDYINLVKRNPKLDTKDALEEIARKSKNFAKTRNILVILLAQLGADERVKYSKAVEEHADNVWIWEYPYNNRPGYIQVKQTKARNQLVYPFYLVEDFSSMRVYDILDPMGLTLLLSRASGLRYKKHVGEYIETQWGVPIPGSPIVFNKHSFINDIDWHEITEQSVPIPNAPDVHTILDMVRESLTQIAIYEPRVAQHLLDNIKNDKLLGPFEDLVDDLELPAEARRLLAQDSSKFQDVEEEHDDLLQKAIEEDKEAIRAAMAESIDDTGVDTDKIADDLLIDDEVTSRESTYDDTHARKEGKKKKKKKNGGKVKEGQPWDVIRDRAIQREVDRKVGKLVDEPHGGIVEMDNPFSTLDLDTSEEKEGLYFAKQDIKPYEDYWIKLQTNTPPTTDTIRTHIEDDGGPPPPAFLSSTISSYMNDFESRINLLDVVYKDKAYRIVEKLQAELFYFFSSEANLKNWLIGYKNEEEERAWIDSCSNDVFHTLHKNKAGLSGLSKKDCIQPEVLHKITTSIPGDYYKNVCKPVDIPPQFDKLLFLLASTAIAKGEVVNRKGALSKLIKSKAFLEEDHDLVAADKIANSPFISLFEKPEYIESITWDNKEVLLKPELFIHTLKPLVLKTIAVEYNKGEYKTMNSVVWALIRRNYRNNKQLLNFVKDSLECTIISTFSTNKPEMYKIKN